MQISKIENKMSLRIVQNCDILLQDVFVPEDDRLPGANSFQDLVNVTIIASHVYAMRLIYNFTKNN